MAYPRLLQRLWAMWDGPSQRLTFCGKRINFFFWWGGEDDDVGSGWGWFFVFCCWREFKLDLGVK